MKKINLRKILASALTLSLLCMNYVQVMAAEVNGVTYTYRNNLDVNVEIEVMSAFSCWNCGNGGFYYTEEYGPEQILEQVKCTHGKNFCYTYVTDVFTIKKCTYCNFTNEKTYKHTITRYECK